MNNNEKKDIVIKPVTDISFICPEKPNNLTDKEYHDINNNLNRNACIVSNNEVVVKKQGVPKILSTDSKGANKFINNLKEDQKIENGDDLFVKLPPIEGELAKRIQEPRDPLTREKLKYNEKALQTIRDAPELETARSVNHQRIENELPKLKSKKIKNENIISDDITGEPLKSNSVAHHVERKADEPNKALDYDNIANLNLETHIEGHQNNFEGKENYEKFKKSKQQKE
jgi:hypothetical protein